MILHTTRVEYLGDYRLFLPFNNGESGETDLSGRLHGVVFDPLRDKSLFATAYQHARWFGIMGLIWLPSSCLIWYASKGSGWRRDGSARLSPHRYT